MAAKTSWHRYGTKLRHCHPMYNEEIDLNYKPTVAAYFLLDVESSRLIAFPRVTTNKIPKPTN